ncbi:pentapeptide repeat-containing protein [Mycetocola spongiae]|uniref:pentapeptide repeat-containing protein n=1 Tax=Mycetocola spongiae TaxID=2859226 RepID=UPI001CF1DF75|nr:pentapeptide repeat-containing protein [Mycetocola spongiae]UCR88415.1 pentapeptide repeat-containing protein [Mycetocola spongiae]
MATRKGLRAPRLDPILLQDLAEGYESELEAGSHHDGLRFSDAQVSGGSLAGAEFAECEFLGLDLSEVELRGVRFVDSRIERLNAPVLKAARSSMRDVRLSNSRIGSGDLYESSWQSVEFIGSKIGYLNLRGATIHDLRFTDCTIDELDLGGARVTRMAFSGSDLDNLDITGSTLVDADLRGLDLRSLRGLESLAGVTMSEEQFARLSPLLAAMLGVHLTA